VTEIALTPLCAAVKLAGVVLVKPTVVQHLLVILHPLLAHVEMVQGVTVTALTPPCAAVNLVGVAVMPFFVKGDAHSVSETTTLQDTWCRKAKTCNN